MTTPLSPLALTIKYATLKRWQESEAGRKERLTDWQAIRLDDGTLMLSARIRGPEPGRALHRFADRQFSYLANRDHVPGDVLPGLDVSVPGREACVWRSGGVWVELWCPDSVPAVPSSPGPVPGPALTVPESSPRGLLGGRLPFARNRRKETAA